MNVSRYRIVRVVSDKPAGIRRSHTQFRSQTFSSLCLLLIELACNSAARHSNPHPTPHYMVLPPDPNTTIDLS